MCIRDSSGGARKGVKVGTSDSSVPIAPGAPCGHKTTGFGETSPAMPWQTKGPRVQASSQYALATLFHMAMSFPAKLLLAQDTGSQSNLQQGPSASSPPRPTVAEMLRSGQRPPRRTPETGWGLARLATWEACQRAGNPTAIIGAARCYAKSLC